MHTEHKQSKNKKLSILTNLIQLNKDINYKIIKKIHKFTYDIYNHLNHHNPIKLNVHHILNNA